MPHPRPFPRAALAASALSLLTLLAGAAGADDTPTIGSSRADPLAQARTLIGQKSWPAAVSELRRINDSRSADWNNLMGYSLRKSTPPDLAGAERHYEAALRIEPAHRGALEYSGELALMQGRLDTAEQRLAALDKACSGRCDELKDLKDAVARYKAAGNRYLPK